MNPMLFLNSLLQNPQLSYSNFMNTLANIFLSSIAKIFIKLLEKFPMEVPNIRARLVAQKPKLISFCNRLMMELIDGLLCNIIGDIEEHRMGTILQHRTNQHELDNQTLALLPVLGAMLSGVHKKPMNREENQPRLQKIMQFWAFKEVSDQSTISTLESEMKADTIIAHVLVDIPGPVPSGFQQQPERQF